MLTTYQVFGAVVGESFSVDIDKSAIRYYSKIFPFYFILLIQVLVICFFFFFFFSVLCVVAVKVTVSVCEAGVKWNYIHLILNRKEPYTIYAENKEKHNIEI